MSVAPQASAHRSDIDGLRALAVLAVIVFHINPGLLPGGFVGVDVFFVISGYLITGHMAAEMTAGTFSLAEFYRRRVKRIAPAMLLVVATTLMVGLALMLPEDIVALAKSAVWSVASLANVYFWREADADYFAPGSEHLPLLHLWSLGVEEQFYLLWPLLMLLLWKLSAPRGGAARARMLTLGLAALLVPMSCVLVAALADRDAMFVYYMLPTRAGELGIGAAAALWLGGRSSGQIAALSRYGQPLAWIGAALLLSSLALLHESGVFPGVRSLAPTLGAALLLMAGALNSRHGLSGLLGCRPARWVGAVSYSAYLWHWPVLAFWRYLLGPLEGLWQVMALVATLLLAGLSYRWVEEPARRTKAGPWKVFLRQFAGPGGLLVLLCAALVYGPRVGLQWQPQAYHEALARLRAEVQPAYRFPWSCQRSRLEARDLAEPGCVLGQPAERAPRVLLWGDSNAAHYIQALNVIAAQAGYNFRNVEVGSCPPVFGDPRAFVKAERYADCRDSVQQLRAVLPDYPVLLISATWTDYQRRSPDFLPQMEATVRQLIAEGHRVVLIGKAPVFTGYDRQCREKALKVTPLHCEVPPRPLDGEVAAVNERLRQIAQRNPGAAYFDVARYLCPEGRCSALSPAQGFRYYDPGHLSVAGSMELGQLILQRDGVPAVLNFRDE